MSNEKINGEDFQKNIQNESKCERLPVIIVGFAIVSILLSFILIYLVDLRNIFGLRDYLFSLDDSYFFYDYRPLLFQNWYRNGGIAELMQWSLLAASAFVSIFIAGKLHKSRTNAYKFWRIMGIGFLLLLIEDAGDPRHTIRSFVQAIFRESIQGPMGSLSELIYFGILAFIIIFAVVKYRNVIKESSRCTRYFIIAFVSYALATSLSFFGTATGIDLYGFLGENMFNWMLALGDEGLAHSWEMINLSEGWNYIGFFLMDSMLEEAIELIGAASFLAGSISYFLFLSNKNSQEDINIIIPELVQIDDENID
ncbi:hypothetical protein [Natronospora cellulosivora (SeqCode)]